MRPLGHRPRGSRIDKWPTDMKIKGLQIQRQIDEPTVSSMLVNWRWDTNLRPQIDKAKEMGANCVKFASVPLVVLSGDLTREEQNEKIRQFLDYCVQSNLYVYWCNYFSLFPGEDNIQLDDPDAGPQLDEICAVAQLLESYDNVIGLDIDNENTSPTSLAVASPIIKAAAPSLPLAQSYIVTHGGFYGRADWEPYVDFWDFHPYYDTVDPLYPTPGDMSEFRVRNTNGKPILWGEAGAYGDTTPPPSAAGVHQQEFWHAMAAMVAEPECVGAIGYTTWGSITEALAIVADDGAGGERHWMTDEFRQWPGRR